MAEVQTPAVSSSKDNALLTLSIVAILSGITAFYWFPEQPLGLRLPKGFKIPHRAEFDFDREKQQLLKIVDAAWHARSPDDSGPHPMFGKMTFSEWGKLLQIHIDYHLKQFVA